MKDYTITRPQIASGAAGIVHEALSHDGRRVAIKVLNREAIEKKLADIVRKRKPGIERNPAELEQEIRGLYERSVEDFKSEYQWLTRLNHPNIAKVYETGFEDDHYYIAYEFIEGKFIAEHVRGWKPVDMIPVFIQALSGLDYIHRNGVIHLDIKPGNILVQVAEEKPTVKIIDFGLAITPEEYSGDFRGTSATMAPEVALGQNELVDARADLFSMAAVMYYCITWGARFPFPRPVSGDQETVRKFIEQREPALEINPPSAAHSRHEGFVPEYLDTIVMRLLARNPSDRFYGNARAVINALATHLPDSFQDTPDTLGSYLRPEMNRYIGRDAEVSQIEENVQTLIEGKSPVVPIFRIAGARGLGKTHFLNRIRETAERHVEKLSIHTITLPATQEALENKIAALTRDLSENAKPLLVLVDNLEDLPEGNGSSQSPLTAISGLARLIAEHKRTEVTYSDIQQAMLVFTTEPESAGESRMAEFEDIVKTIALEPFCAADIEEYLLSTPALKAASTLDATRKIVHDRAEALHRRTAGIPRELVDTLQELDSKGVLFDASGELVLADIPAVESSAKQAPASTRERLLAEYRLLPRPDQEATEIMACWCCKPFLPSLREKDVQEFLHRYANPQALNNLVQRGIVEHNPGAKTYSFVDSDYMPALIHEEMDPKYRDSIHTDIAGYLGDLTEGEHNLRHAIMLHLAFGSDKCIAIRNCIILGRNLLYKEGRCAISIELFERALELIESENWKLRVYVYSLLSEACYYSERITEALKAVADGLAICTSASWKISLKLRSLAYHLNCRELDNAKETIREVKEELSDRRNITAYPILLNYEARYHYELAISGNETSQENMDKAKELFEESELIEESINFDSQKRINNNLLYRCLRSLGDYSLAAEQAEKRLKDREMNIFSNIASYVELADVYRLALKYELALDCAKNALSQALESRLQYYIYYAYGVLANVYHDMDDFENSIKVSNQRIASGACISGSNEYDRLSAHTWNHIGHCYKELKKWDKGIVYFDAAIAKNADEFTKMSALEGSGEVYHYKGDYEREEEYFNKAEELLSNMSKSAYVDSHRFRILKIRAETHLGKKEFDNARRIAAELRPLAGDDSKKIQECDELMAKIPSPRKLH